MVLIGFFWSFVLLAIVFLSDQALAASSAVYVNETGGVIIVNERGSIDYWLKGDTKPKWSVPIGGAGVGARSRVAAMQIDKDGNLLVVERYGAIKLFSLKGKLLQARLPLYAYVRLNGPASTLANWTEHVEEVDHTSAAYLATGDDLYLSPSETSEVLAMHQTEVLKRGLPDAIKIGEFWRFFPKEAVELVVAQPRTPDVESRTWALSERDLHPTAVAVCKGVIINGSKEGFVIFNSQDDTSDKGRRVRQIGSADDDDIRDVIDAGCIGEDMAFTVAFESENGEIQLWDLKSRSMLDSVGSNSNGHPGMAFAALASKSGKYLLSLGDGDVRLWSVFERKFKLLNFYELSMDKQEQAFAVAATDDDGFVYWDGSCIWKVSALSTEPTRYAGRCQS